MGKSRKTITIDDNLARLVDDHDEFNLSGFVNTCLEQHFAGTGPTTPEETALRAELERIEGELQEVNQREESLRERRERLEKQIEDTQDDEHELMEQAREVLSTAERDPTNVAIQNWASKLGMTPEALIDELPERETTAEQFNSL